MTTTTELSVEGIAGTEEVARVRTALRERPGVQDVLVELTSGAPARVTIVSREPLDTAELRGTAEGAGFHVLEVSVTRDAEAVAFASQAKAMQNAHTEAAHPDA